MAIDVEFSTNVDSADIAAIRAAVLDAISHSGASTRATFGTASVKLAYRWFLALQGNLTRQIREEFVLAQARLMWAYRGRLAPPAGSPDVDYFDAERHIKALAACRFLESSCPLAWLTMRGCLPSEPLDSLEIVERITLLSDLRVDEVVRCVAYMVYLERCGAHLRPSCPEEEFADYVGAADFVKLAFIRTRCCSIQTLQCSARLDLYRKAIDKLSSLRRANSPANLKPGTMLTGVIHNDALMQHMSILEFVLQCPLE